MRCHNTQGFFAFIYMGQGNWVLRVLTNITRDSLLFVTNGWGGYGRIFTAIDGYPRQCLLAWLKKSVPRNPDPRFLEPCSQGPCGNPSLALENDTKTSSQGTLILWCHKRLSASLDPDC